MTRGRFVSTSVAKDKRLNELPIDSALVYVMTIPHLDRDGIIDGDPSVLWGTVCPRRRELLDEMERIILDWTYAGLVVRYETEEGTALWFSGFTKNQQGLRYDREAPSRFPLPSELNPDGDKPTPDEVRTNSGAMPDDVPPKFKYKYKYKGNGSPLSVDSPAPSTEQATATEYTARAKAMGLDAKQLRQNVDTLLDIVGKRALVDANPNDRDTTFILNDAKEAVLSLAPLGYGTPDMLKDLAESWQATNAWRKAPPTFRQLKEHASAVSSGVQPKVQTATNGWAGLNSDIPEYMKD